MNRYLWGVGPVAGPELRLSAPLCTCMHLQRKCIDCIQTQTLRGCIDCEALFEESLSVVGGRRARVWWLLDDRCL